MVWQVIISLWVWLGSNYNKRTTLLVPRTVSNGVWCIYTIVTERYIVIRGIVELMLTLFQTFIAVFKRPLRNTIAPQKRQLHRFLLQWHASKGRSVSAATGWSTEDLLFSIDISSIFGCSRISYLAPFVLLDCCLFYHTFWLMKFQRETFVCIANRPGSVRKFSNEAHGDKSLKIICIYLPVVSSVHGKAKASEILQQLTAEALTNAFVLAPVVMSL